MDFYNNVKYLEMEIEISP